MSHMMQSLVAATKESGAKSALERTIFLPITSAGHNVLLLRPPEIAFTFHHTSSALHTHRLDRPIHVPRSARQMPPAPLFKAEPQSAVSNISIRHPRIQEIVRESINMTSSMVAAQSDSNQGMAHLSVNMSGLSVKLAKSTRKNDSAISAQDRQRVAAHPIQTDTVQEFPSSACGRIDSMYFTRLVLSRALLKPKLSAIAHFRPTEPPTYQMEPRHQQTVLKMIACGKLSEYICHLLDVIDLRSALMRTVPDHIRRGAHATYGSLLVWQLMTNGSINEAVRVISRSFAIRDHELDRLMLPIILKFGDCRLLYEFVGDDEEMNYAVLAHLGQISSFWVSDVGQVQTPVGKLKATKEDRDCVATSSSLNGIGCATC
ncbi:hypothetical protein EDD11_007405 [Mortierella claussenii]|nr:hypothetical protein EDD11_007405 [Mortierella claussenii]